MNPNSTAIVTVNQRGAVDVVRVQPKLSSSSSSTSSSRTVSIPNKKVRDVRGCSYTRMLVQNHSNFKRSGPPARFLFYENGSWGDFAGEVIGSLTAGFVEGNALFEVGISGARYLFDLGRMLQVDLESGSQRSIAWIDVYGRCFFPKIFVDGGGKFSYLASDPKNEVLDISQYPRDKNLNVAENLPTEDPKSEIEIGIGGNLNSTKRKKEFVEIESEEYGKEKSEGSSSDDQIYGAKRSRLTRDDVESPRWPKTKLLKEGEKAYSIVKNLFLSGIGSVEPGATITSVYQCMRSGSLDRARYEVFQKQVEITKAARGEVKITFGWHGTSAEGVADILSHGFAMPRKISGSEAHGIGIYLSPVRLPHISAMLSEVDNNGEKHVMLCRVILGNCEKVDAGSQQLYPSSVDFDTGVDDVKNPKWYVVWCANMNTHILPECVVSYRSSDLVPGQLGRSSYVKYVPGSSTALFAKLLSKLGSFLPSSRVQEFRTLFTAYKDGKVAKDALVKQLRSVVGDDTLASVIREVRG